MESALETAEALTAGPFANLTAGEVTTEVYLNATTAPPPDKYNPLQATLIGLSAALLSFGTIAGNLMVMVSFKMDKQLQTISNYFLFSLAVADMIIGAVSMPLFTLYKLQQEWTLGEVVCDAWLSVDYLASNASVLNLLVISFDRYFSVTRPLTYRARRTTKKAALMIFSAWGVSAVMWPPWIVAWPYIEGSRTVPPNDCYIQFIYSNEWMSILTIIVAFFAPVSIMCGLYVRVWWETVKRQRELVHLQAGKKSHSKRSDSSDETQDDVVASRAVRGWRSALASTGGGGSGGGGGGGGAGGSAPPSSIGGGVGDEGGKQDVTYVPTSMLRTRSSTNSLLAGGSADQKTALCPSFLTGSNGLCAACLNPDGDAVEDGSSEGGYTTPRSLETPVQTQSSKCSSLNPIRDPYSTRQGLRHSASIEDRLQRYYQPAALGQHAAASHHQQHQSKLLRGGSHGTATAGQRAVKTSSTNSAPPGNGKMGGGDDDAESIYTILIRFPSKHEPQQDLVQQAPPPPPSFQDHPTPTVVGAPPKRVPSIQMLQEDVDASAFCASSSSSRSYPRSLPLVRRFDSVDSGTATATRECAAGPKRSSSYLSGGRSSRSANQSSTSSPALRKHVGGGGRHRAHNNGGGAGGATFSPSNGSGNHDDISRLPLDTKLVPRQLLKQGQQSGVGGGAGSNASTLSTGAGRRAQLGGVAGVVGVATKAKKATSEKKQDRKAAKTLSAILLAFIVTWTPYSVLVVISALLGKERADQYIPSVLWDFSYYLCYINSTVNPVLYALCNAAFRRTYLRILTCRWKANSARQPVNRYYYG